MKYVLIIGAKSNLGRSLAETYAKNNYSLYLAGRDIESIADYKESLVNKYNINIILCELDICNLEKHKNFYSSLKIKPIGVIVAVGFYPDQKNAELDWKLSKNTVGVNFLGPMSLLNIISNDMKQRKSGFIVGISSISGDRGRKKNYIYGSSKSGFTEYLSGLRNSLHSYGISVLTVKLGFMNENYSKQPYFIKILTSDPSYVSYQI